MSTHGNTFKIVTRAEKILKFFDFLLRNDTFFVCDTKTFLLYVHAAKTYLKIIRVRVQ